MPRKIFTAGEVLAAADVNSLLMDQTVMTFAGTAARGSAIGTATEGMVVYLADSNTIQVATGPTTYEQVFPAAITSLSGTAVVFGATAVSSNYTAVAGLDNSTIWVNGTAAVTITVPDVLATGDSLNILRNAGGTVTIAAGDGVTDWGGAGTAGTAVTFKIDQTYNGAQVIKVAANTYRVIGKIVP